MRLQRSPSFTNCPLLALLLTELISVSIMGAGRIGFREIRISKASCFVFFYFVFVFSIHPILNLYWTNSEFGNKQAKTEKKLLITITELQLYVEQNYYHSFRTWYHSWVLEWPMTGQLWRGCPTWLLLFQYFSYFISRCQSILISIHERVANYWHFFLVWGSSLHSN